MNRFAFAVMCLPLLFVPAAKADDLCGATIVEHLKLEHDLICAGDGLIVGADGIKVDLNGFTILGSGVGSGVDVVGRTQVTIVGGTVRNFFAGVRTRDSSGIVITHMELVENVDGVDLNQRSTGNTVKHSEFRNNRSRGIMIRSFSTLHVVKDNTFTGDRVGILLFGGVDNLVEHNVVSGSVLAGIRLNVIATGNSVVKNTVLSNPAGIEFLLTPTGGAVGNTVAKNTIVMNVCGIKGPTDGNTLEKNLFESNGVDTCP
jgi:nitrous oxidase accessory protein NosD